MLSLLARACFNCVISINEVACDYDQNEASYGMSFIQTSTLTPSMHPKLTEHGKLCMRNNQLPTKTLVELMDNSSMFNKQFTSF